MPTVQTHKPKAKAAPRIVTTAKIAPGAPKAAPRSRADKAALLPSSVPALNAEEREKLVAQAAYFRAEKRGFAPGCELQDWIEAEAEVLRLIGGA